MSELREGQASVNVSSTEEEVKILGEMIMLFMALDHEGRIRVLRYVTDMFTANMATTD
jgi:hypothetical protein